MRWGVLLAAAFQVACLEVPPDSTGTPDTPDTPDAGGALCSELGPWSDPIVVPGLEYEVAASPTVDADGDFIVWQTSGPDSDLDAALRDGDQFVPVAETVVSLLNSSEPERNPTLSADGRTIWYTRGTAEATFLVSSHREDAGDLFSEVVEVTGIDPGLEGPDFWDLENELYFSVKNTDFDIARASCVAAESCDYLGVVNDLVEGMDDLYPTIRSDGLELLYNRTLTGVLMQTSRLAVADDFTEGTVLPFPGYAPELTGDGRTLYFASDGKLYTSTRDCLE